MAYFGDGSNLSGVSGVPQGFIGMWYGATNAIPSGWALCDGSVVNGLQTPDLRDRFVVGAGSSYAVDATGGSANATLPTHSHDKGTLSVTGGDHSHGYTFLNQNVSHGGGSSAYGRTTTSASTGGSGSLTMSVSGSTGSEGSSATNANLPPYYALAYIMKT